MQGTTTVTLKGSPILGSGVPDQSAAVENAPHAAVTPCSGGVPQLLLCVNRVDQHGGAVWSRPTDDLALGVCDKTWPGVFFRSIVCTHSEIVAGCCSLDRCRDANRVHVQLLLRHACIVERDKHEFNTQSFVLAEEFRVSEIVTDKESTLDPSQAKGDHRLSRTVVTQVTVLVVFSAAEHFVVPIHNLPPVIYDVEGIVRFVIPGESVVAAHDHPQAVLPGRSQDLAHGRIDPIPVSLPMRLNFDTKVSGEAGLGEMHEVGPFGLCHFELPQHGFKVPLRLLVNTELTGCQYKGSHSSKFLSHGRIYAITSQRRWL